MFAAGTLMWITTVKHREPTTGLEPHVRYAAHKFFNGPTVSISQGWPFRYNKWLESADVTFGNGPVVINSTEPTLIVADIGVSLVILLTIGFVIEATIYFSAVRKKLSTH
jgi:hypothetical protein